jgi:hypothetical protein
LCPGGKSWEQWEHIAGLSNPREIRKDFLEEVTAKVRLGG